ncbi:metabotropic glutamate receptor 6-like [Frankliniella occidentalis]|uniref:Metabotropic glutamate receptor 6-like n=1 Tax=Frankliniella occidentalis TaxID=133901 RepID=A0A9C6XAS9_FRAOC|nr:metabotropic glutamate receptor 6-like [Frankliniella occidentalis]
MLSSLAANYSVCFASPVHRIDKQDFTDEEATNVVLSLNSSEAKIVIVFSESFQSSMVRLLLKARDLDVLERFTWVFSDLWTDKFSERADRGWQAKLLEGSICVHPMSRQLFGFDEYFMSLKLDHQQVNPWWTELWRSHFGCRDDESTKGQCDNPRATVRDVHGAVPMRQARYLHFVRDAIWAVAQALTDLQRDRCGGEPGMCAAMSHIQGTVLRDYLARVQFNDVNRNRFTFQNGRDGPPRYSVLNYQRTIGAASSPASAAGPPRYGWVSVGDYTMNEDGSGPHLHVDSASIRSRADAPLPSSTCTPTCRAGQIKTRARDACCWYCRGCGEFQVRQNDWTCEDCPAGSRPTPDHLQCLLVPEEHIGYTHPWAIAAMAVASFGLVATVLVSAVFWTHRNTPVIKAAGRELSALLLVAELASYLVTFVMVAPPTNATCGLTRFALGFCFTLSYAAVLTKTNRIARIFNQCPGAGPKKTRYTSPGSQLVITALLTSVEALINLAWLTYEPARVRDHFPSRDVRQRICVGLDNYSYLVGLIYPLVLIGLCVVYAVKTRKCPGGFNETRHIAFTTYTVTIIWLAFVPLYLASTSTALRTVTLAMSLSLSGLVQLGCLFCPKVYIVILKPEKNTKEVVMMSTCHRTLGSTGTLPAHHLTTNPAAALVKARLEGRSPCPSELGSDMSPAMAGSLADHDEALSLSH